MLIDTHVYAYLVVVLCIAHVLSYRHSHKRGAGRGVAAEQRLDSEHQRPVAPPRQAGGRGRRAAGAGGQEATAGGLYLPQLQGGWRKVSKTWTVRQGGLAYTEYFLF